MILWIISALSNLLSPIHSSYSLRSNNITVDKPQTHTELGQTDFNFAPPWCWDLPQKELKSVAIPLNKHLKHFRSDIVNVFTN